MLVVLMFFTLTATVISAEKYQPKSGDSDLDASLQRIQKAFIKKTKVKKSQFVDKVAEEFQIPVNKVEELFNFYEFKAPDVLLSVSIADISGEPLQNISALYFKNKEKGWEYTLKQFNLHKGSKNYNLIKKDMSAEF